MATNFASSSVSAGDDATAQQYNDLREDVIKNAGDYEVTAGSADTYTLAVDSAISAYTEGDKFRFQVHASNTGASTLNVNSIGAKTIKKNHDVDLESGDLETNMIVEVVYDANGDVFQLQTPHANQMSSANSATLTDGSNADSLHDHNFASKIIADNSEVNINSSAAETNLLQVSVPANSLGTDNALVGQIFVQNFGLISSGDFTLRLKYGSTTIQSVNIDNLTGGTVNGLNGMIHFNITADGGTSAQKGQILMMLMNADIDAADAAHPKGVTDGGAAGTASEDSTGALNLTITGQFSGSSGGNVINTQLATVYLIK